MRTIPPLPFTSVATLSTWSNFHHTIVNRSIPAYVTPGTVAPPPGTTSERADTQALNALLTYCLASPVERLCTIGSRWSLSNILDPGNVLLDPGTWNQLAAVNEAWVTPAYRSGAAPGTVPIIAQGGATIRLINNFLGDYGLALKTTGASDGHRIAGCIATGTHGSHLNVGAVHDTVLGIYIVTGPNQAVLLQPTQRSFTADLTKWFSDATGFATQDLPADETFNAAKVALGGLGFVHSVIIEAEPLYQLGGECVGRPLEDPAIWRAISTLDTSGLNPMPNPDFFSVIFSPYANDGANGAFATMLWKRKPNSAFVPSPPVPSSISSDTSRLLSSLIPLIDAGLVGQIVGKIVAAQTEGQYPPRQVQPVFPGTYFGPTNLPEGNGRSSEVVVPHSHAEVAVRTVIDTLRAQAKVDKHLLGAIGVRFIPKTTALLGPNLATMNTYIEFPSLASADISAIYAAVWKALGEKNIPFTCHWGQEYGMDSASVLKYFGVDRVARWKAARVTLLPTPEARGVFTNPMIEKLGLG